MPKLYSPRHIVKVLEKRGFVFISQKGSHIKYKKKTSKETLTVIVPIHSREIPIGTFKSILRQSRLLEDDFKK